MLILGAEEDSKLKVIYASGVDQTTANRLHLTSEDLDADNGYLPFDKNPQLIPFFSRRIVDLFKGIHIKEIHGEDTSSSVYFLFLIKDDLLDSPWDLLDDAELGYFLLKSLNSFLRPDDSANTSLEKKLEEKIKSGSSLLYRIELAQSPPEDYLFYVNTIIQAERTRRLFDKITGERVSAYSISDHVFLLVYPDFLSIDPTLLEHQLKTALSESFNINLDWDNLQIKVKKLEVLDEKLLAFLDGENSEP